LQIAGIGAANGLEAQPIQSMRVLSF